MTPAPLNKPCSFTYKVNAHKSAQRQLAVCLECQPDVCVCVYVRVVVCVCLCKMASLPDSSGGQGKKAQERLCAHVFVCVAI